jgi:hypothetical protein
VQSGYARDPTLTSFSDIDHNMFVLSVDLWSVDGKDEVNLVRHATISPQISTAEAHSWAETKPTYAHIQQALPPQGGPRNEPYNSYPQHGAPSVSQYSQGQPPGRYQQQGYPPNGHQPYPGPPSQAYVPPGAVTGAQIHAQGIRIIPGESVPAPPTPYSGPGNPPTRRDLSSIPQGMFTRNLIGSLAASAFRLTDTEDKIGIWFILQDLSVRTEGHFR